MSNGFQKKFISEKKKWEEIEFGQECHGGVSKLPDCRKHTYSICTSGALYRRTSITPHRYSICVCSWIVGLNFRFKVLMIVPDYVKPGS